MTIEIDQAQSLIALSSQEAWRHSPEAQVLTFQQLGVLLPALEDSERRHLRRHFATLLAIPEARFDYLVKMRNERDLRVGLGWKRVHIELDHDERIYNKAKGWLKRYMHYARLSEAHLGFHFWSGIAILAAACRRNFYIEMGGHQEILPNQYILLEGPSGCGKNTAIETAHRVLEGMNVVLEERQLRSESYTLPTVHVFPRRVQPDLFLDLLRDHARRLPTTLPTIHGQYEQCGLLVVEELTTLLGKGLRGSDTMIHLLTALYDGRFDEATRRSGYVAMDRVALTCLFGSTMEWLRKDMDPNIFKGGFLGARCIMISKMKSNRVFPPPIPELDPVQREALSEALAEYALAKPTPLRLSEKAQKCIASWYERSASKHGVSDPRLAAYLERRDIHLIKLAMGLALSNAELEEISEESMSLAIEILMHEEPRMMSEFKTIGGARVSSDMDRIVQALYKLDGYATQGQLYAKVRTRMPKERFEELVWALRLEGRLERKLTPAKHRGPTRIDWFIPGSDADPARRRKLFPVPREEDEERKRRMEKERP